MDNENLVSDSKQLGQHSTPRDEIKHRYYNPDSAKNWRYQPHTSNSCRSKVTNWRTKDVSETSKTSNNNWRMKETVSMQENPTQFQRIREEEFESFFQLKMSYVKKSDWILPDVSRAYSSGCYDEFESFQKMREDLTNFKYGGNLRDLFSESEWKDISEEFQFNDSIVRFLKHQIKLGYVVKNWTKAYEIFSEYLPVPNGEFNSVHIGDTSGGLITALNHFLHSNSPFDTVKWNWKAICDNPYYEGNTVTNR